MEVLLVSDSRTITDVLPPFIAPPRLHICHTGSDAAELLESLRPDLLLLDLRLWDTDGFELLHNSQYKPLRVLALTDLLTTDSVAAAEEAGIQDMLIIPFSLPEIPAYLDALSKETASPED